LDDSKGSDSIAETDTSIIHGSVSNNKEGGGLINLDHILKDKAKISLLKNLCTNAINFIADSTSRTFHTAILRDAKVLNIDVHSFGVAGIVGETNLNDEVEDEKPLETSKKNGKESKTPSLKPIESEPVFIEHIVVQGLVTFIDICEHYSKQKEFSKLTPTQIVADNPGVNPHDIHIGDKIRIRKISK
jgi:hypothetical protein